jgi:hypothetical protein
MKNDSFSGINIQWPISTLILDGNKTIETRTYPIPSKYVGKTLFFIETPGPSKEFKARIVGTITFKECFKYKNENHFYKDISKHKVTKNSKWAWKSSKPKWGWIIESVTKFENYKSAPLNKGIIFTSRCDF